MNRRLLILALFSTSAAATSALAAQKIKMPDWNNGAEEIEEAKFEKAFLRLKNDAGFRAAVFAGDVEVLTQLFKRATKTNYNVDFTFKGKGNIKINFAIRCHKVNGQWQFSITFSRT